MRSGCRRVTALFLTAICLFVWCPPVRADVPIRIFSEPVRFNLAKNPGLTKSTYSVLKGVLANDLQKTAGAMASDLDAREAVLRELVRKAVLTNDPRSLLAFAARERTLPKNKQLLTILSRNPEIERFVMEGYERPTWATSGIGAIGVGTSEIGIGVFILAGLFLAAAAKSLSVSRQLPPMPLAWGSAGVSQAQVVASARFVSIAFHPIPGMDDLFAGRIGTDQPSLVAAINNALLAAMLVSLHTVIEEVPPPPAVRINGIPTLISTPGKPPAEDSLYILLRQMIEQQKITNRNAEMDMKMILAILVVSVIEMMMMISERLMSR